ncbi:MAG: hypothetical protein FWG09_06960 [Synergistaceae bacterium]|nr:hypothetical protein [Synergistaceae bacterium]
MERNVTEELVEALKKKKTDFMSLSSLNKALPAALKKRLGLTSGSSGAQIAKSLSPHVGDVLMIRQNYLVFKQTDELLLRGIVQKNNGKIPRMDRIPFKKDEFLAVLNRLIEQGAMHVKINSDYKPILTPAEGNFQPQTPKDANISGEKFKEAYFELERGKFYVRICDLRRHLSLAAQEFDAMLTGLRDRGKVQLQGGDTDFFTEEDIRESFIDENGFRKLTMMWRR